MLYNSFNLLGALLALVVSFGTDTGVLLAATVLGVGFCCFIVPGDVFESRFKVGLCSGFGDSVGADCLLTFVDVPLTLEAGGVLATTGVFGDW